MAKLNLDKFGKILDSWLESVDGKMLLHMPEGTQKVEVQDNIGAGSVVQFYFLLQAFCTIGKEMAEDMELDRKGEEWQKVVDAMLKMLERDLLEGEP